MGLEEEAALLVFDDLDSCLVLDFEAVSMRPSH